MKILQQIINTIIVVVEHIEIKHINIVILISILMLNIFFMGLYWKQLKEYKCMPFAIHITEKLFKSKNVNNVIKDKIKKIHICDNWEISIKKHYYKKISVIIFVIVSVNILILFILQTKDNEAILINNQYINRPKYGERSKKVNLNVEFKDSSGKKNTSNVDICVEPNRLSEKEECELIRNVKEYIRKNAIGNNRKYGEIKEKLNLITSYKMDSNIKISWSLDEQGLISSDGDIVYSSANKEKLKQGIDIVLIAKIKYFQHEYEYPLYMTILQKEDTKDNVFLNRLNENINDLNSKYNKDGVLVLPEKIDNMDISYRETEVDTKFNNCVMVIIIGVIIIYVICKAMVKDLDAEIDRKNTTLLMYYGEIINKIQLLICAGLNITSAWKKICEDYLNEKERIGKFNYAYEEMVYTYRRIDMGISPREAFREFGKRIGLSQYIKISSLIVQNMNIGAEGFIDALEIEGRNRQNESKELYIRQGEKLGIKLLLPMMIMMLITMVIVVVPAFLSM